MIMPRNLVDICWAVDPAVELLVAALAFTLSNLSKLAFLFSAYLAAFR